MCTVDWDTARAVFAPMPEVVAVWGFGSAQGGTLRPGSDLDLGVLFAAPPTLDRLADLRADLQQALQCEAIDLVVLNHASPILCFEAVCGRLIFCRDAGQRAAFVSLTAREYEESMAMVQRALAVRATVKPYATCVPTSTLPRPFSQAVPIKEACAGKPQAGCCEGEAHNGAGSNTVTRSKPQGESNGEHKADLHTESVLSTRLGEPISQNPIPLN